eukprot:m51a1_g10852 hypothetical protein (146) ;mRNA; r:15944-16381
MSVLLLAAAACLLGLAAALAVYRLADRHVEREARTLGLMVRLYCRAHHAGSSPGAGDALCPDCAEVLAFARARLRACPYGERKPVCALCRVHCWRARPEVRQRVAAVMWYSGPRLLLCAPWLALNHFVDAALYWPRAPRPAPKAC